MRSASVFVYDCLRVTAARAKDPEQLFRAIETKLIEQRKFVLWWDGQEKQQGARGGGKKVASQICDATLQAGRGGLPDRYIIERWRKRLSDEGKFALALEDARHHCRRICEQEKISTVFGTQGTGEQCFLHTIGHHEPRDIRQGRKGLAQFGLG